ncbi:MAG: DUF2288 domain-containing protein [Gammaproteobacteria bacterium]|nr:MAG: DUF2288 domain-containing protein [Gammaproteobacteria bacterium]
MTDETPVPEDTVRSKIVSETAKVGWRELMREFAGGRTLMVHSELDVIEVAYQLHMDNAALVALWLKADEVRPVSDDEAGLWYEGDRLVWASVVKPWVLVQLAE